VAGDAIVGCIFISSTVATILLVDCLRVLALLPRVRTSAGDCNAFCRALCLSVEVFGLPNAAGDPTNVEKKKETHAA
jgi:hypothetical protein